MTVQLGKYRHYKGYLYEVLAVAKHSETLAPMVVYRALYGEHGVWVRPLDMFQETVVMANPLPASPLIKGEEQNRGKT